uniref:Uncharacterized protein n=1 Tax=Octopus bimaculoides TaxID=37653 RepID=A0A0L8I0N0_OCTBM
MLLDEYQLQVNHSKIHSFRLFYLLISYLILLRLGPAAMTYASILNVSPPESDLCPCFLAVIHFQVF